MGLLHCITTHRTFHLLLSVLLLLSSTPGQYSAEGRPSFRLLEVANLQGRGEEKAMVRALIGSRPPICERRCVTCGRCEAVQVPVIPQAKSRSRQFLGVAILRGDYSSNYKPLSWKCKCGDVIFNP
ncbi:unnamed protein product [Musa acuminata subsp. malaccensis]|uniref:Epidermal patterning factor-like protein n=1 Tax=Musa acuminata subsp. malaccensis TaxID=214687 RepID=A0A804IYN0_MUSAM|nr:PREDICTED: EPIDERMAL PATTERNING FACTOR-like protein 2 [Musa acuminata subsp. malaccensis]CAG1844679.1 unnamed protein product [Musa acuminata subsp. malaccensis]